MAGVQAGAPRPPPQRQQRGSVRQGGTALLWPCSGKSSAFACPLSVEQSHRVCGRVFPTFALISFYGDARRADTRLLASLLRSVADLRRPALLIGDFNWKQQYESLMQHVGAEMFPVINIVVASNGSPTHALAFGSAANPSASARALPGIPHHKAVCYGCDTQASRPKQAQRYRRCTTYTWHWPREPAPDQVAHMVSVSQRVGPQAPELHVALEDWHCRAEAACQAAVSMGLASLSKPAERAKGSTASVRLVATGADYCVGESILLRRWKRLHRAAAQCEAEAGGDAPLTHSQVRHWTSLLAGVPLPVNQSHAIQMANAAIMEEDARLKQEQAKLWRNRFKRASTDALRAGAGALQGRRPSRPRPLVREHDCRLGADLDSAQWQRGSSLGRRVTNYLLASRRTWQQQLLGPYL